jgi:hypothetical protein
MPAAFGQNGARFAWVGDRVVVADLVSGERTKLARGGTEYETPVAVAGSTVVWLQVVGGNSKIDTLRAAAPGRERRFGRWGDDDYYLGSGPRLGGIAADRKRLAYALYRLTSDQRRSDDCYEKGICTWHVTGGGTFLVSPGSLARRRILPPASAVAIHGNTVAVATLARGARYTGKAQIVLLNLADGSRHSIGKSARVERLLLDRDLLVAVIHQDLDDEKPPIVRVWSVKTRQLIARFRLPRGTRFEHFGLAGQRIVFQAFSRGQAIFSMDLRSGLRKVVAHPHSNFLYGPWVWRGRAVWVEQTYGRHPGSVVRSAPLR